jgi:predicted cation transporter
LLLWPFVITGIVLAATPILFLREGKGASAIHLVAESHSWAPVLIRAGKVYIFIVGLVTLSAGIRPIVDAWLHHLPAALLFWINTISAVLDNATLAAIEIGPALNVSQQRYAMLGLLISGGMLIPGNIPNIVVASRARDHQPRMGRARPTYRRPLIDVVFYRLDSSRGLLKFHFCLCRR